MRRVNKDQKARISLTLNGRKMAAEGSDWLTNPQTQIRWGEDYIQAGTAPPARPGPTGRSAGTTGRC